MEISFFIYIFYTLYLLVIDKTVYTDRILGCNGFIKSNVPIDLSKVEVKLFSKEGNLKDHIECAPNNGYFFLPIYDKGEYILQAASPYRWVFEPKEVKISFDGVNDACSKGHDINFNFKGFRVFGKVTSVSNKKGPKGVTITLVADLPTEQKEIHTIVTDENGSFDISPVLPGSYIIRCSHPTWRISKSLSTFVVEKGNFELPPKSLIFAGYDVSGSVVSNGEPIAGVYFILFNFIDTAVESAWLAGCDSNPIEEFNISDLKLPNNVKQLCHVKSNSKGQFLFPSVPTGNYLLVPFYRTINSLKFDVQPRHVRFSVNDDSHVFAKPFQVSGFSVIGRLISHRENGRPLPKVSVTLDNDKVTESDKMGIFIFEGVKSGSHDITVQSSDYLFPSLQLKISPNSATLEDIYPSSYKVCGNIKKLQLIETKIGFLNSQGSLETANTDQDGHFCHYLESGDYTVRIISKETDPVKLLWFFPESVTIKVKDDPVKNIHFEQKTGYVTGTVECLDDTSCDEITIALRNVHNSEPINRISTRDLKYTFSDLYPGDYELSILNNEEWCWESRTILIHVSEISNVASAFKRVGISFIVSSSHNTKLRYKKLSPNKTVEKEGTLEIREGIQENCLPGDSLYNLEPVGCHGYAESVIRWEVGQDSLILTALTHEITVSILSFEKVNDMFVEVYTEQKSGFKTRIGPLKPNLDNKRGIQEYIYKFSFQAGPDEKFSVVPESNNLLFTPSRLIVIGTNDCKELDEYIIAKKGIRLQGQIEPPLQEVKVSILNEFDEVVVSMFTDNEGKYQFIPLHSDHQYRVFAEKEGYTLTGPFQNGSFKAHKLAEVQVTLLDEENKPLQGVLLSLSGGENYRQTSQSNGEGKITFLSLKPSEYYLRPMLKEYKFSPPSKVVTIKEGESVSVSFKGHRVLYSIFGSVTSLNRIPEKDIVLEAVSKAEEECVQHQEEGTTDENGNFRIRGLQPQCHYDVRLKEGSNINKAVFKILPEDTTIKMNATDIENINLISILTPAQCDVWVHISVVSQSHFKTLQVKLLDEEGNVMHTVKINEWKLSRYKLNSLIVTFPTLSLNNKNYYVQLDSVLPKSLYMHSANVVQFTTNSTYKVIETFFESNMNIPSGEVKHTYSTAVLFVLAALIYWFKEELVQVFSQLPNHCRFTVPEFINKYTQQPKVKENENTYIEFEPGLTVIKRKLKPRKM